VDVADLAARYAPLVVLHRGEKLLPASPDWFIERSQLRWATGRGLDGDPVPEAGSRIDAGRLGAASESA
jgi:Vacuolar protein sorting-associated protein 62